MFKVRYYSFFLDSKWKMRFKTSYAELIVVLAYIVLTIISIIIGTYSTAIFIFLIMTYQVQSMHYELPTIILNGESYDIAELSWINSDIELEELENKTYKVTINNSEVE